MATASAVTTNAPMTAEEKKVIFASSLGTVFEWYDFYLYGSLAAIIGKQFFTGLDPTAQFIASLMAPSVRVLGSQLVARSSTLASTCATRLAEKAPIASISSTSSAKPRPSLTPTFKSDSIPM